MDIMLQRILELIPKKPDGKFVHGAKKVFSDSIGLATSNVISDWESGRSVSYKNYLYTIAAKYNVSVEWLKGETDEKNPIDDAKLINEIPDDLFNIIVKATPEQRDDILKYARYIVGNK